VYDYKQQLYEAYKAKSPSRVYKAKRGLIRYLRELSDSPELGPPPDFRWSLELTICIHYSFDPKLTASILELHSYRRVADELERSLQ